MTAVRLLSEVQNRGVQVWVEGNMLRLRARKGVVDSQTIAQFSAHKAEIISILTERRCIKHVSEGKHPLSKSMTPMSAGTAGAHGPVVAHLVARASQVVGHQGSVGPAKARDF